MLLVREHSQHVDMQYRFVYHLYSLCAKTYNFKTAMNTTVIFGQTPLLFNTIALLLLMLQVVLYQMQAYSFAFRLVDTTSADTVTK